MMPVLFSAPTLIITDLKKTFAVFGLMSIRLAICLVLRSWSRRSTVSRSRRVSRNFRATLSRFSAPRGFLSKCLPIRRMVGRRSEEHTSELQSHSDLVCRLLLEKKNKTKKTHVLTNHNNVTNV